jgi:hypothetical protein
LAMLLAVTSSIVWWTARPLMAANIPRIMVIGFLSGRPLPRGVRLVGPCWCGG